MQLVTRSDLLGRRTEQLFAWLSECALPLWSGKGVDHIEGGFIEQILPSGEVISDVRRARLVARQIFAFKTAAQLGWPGPADALVRHGVEALLQHHISDERLVLPRYLPARDRSEGDFDLYDQAFVLFGLAHAFEHTRDSDLSALAQSILAPMQDSRAHSLGGFAEHVPPRSPLKANPHMHLLEAALAWTEVSSDQVWKDLSDGIVRLCLDRFLDPATGALHEYFGIDWCCIEDPAIDVVEPGHQAEWAWLLLRWNRLHGSAEISAVAKQLIEIAEQNGVEPGQNAFVNELNADLSPRDRRLRLWPQTERIKALLACAELEAAAERRSELLDRAAEALEALLRHFDHPISGSWWEHLTSDGRPVDEPARASSLYHIMGAANELARVCGSRIANSSAGAI